MTDKIRQEKFERYGWACSEANLSTLPSTAPEEIKGLAKWLTLEGRRSSLEEWVGCVQDDGKLHGKFWPIGAWTHRMSHSNPNQANIPSAFHGVPTSAVEEVKAKYDHKLRELFYSDHWLVGCDASGIQLRILAHYMKSPEYRDAILSGSSADGTDIHNLNRKKLGPVCKDRDTAKTFIYGFVLGAGIPKVANILECSIAQASSAQTSFIDSLPGLKKLKSRMIPHDAARGYFIGFDGRKVPCSSEHLMLAGYLQNGETIVMRYATLRWMKAAKAEGIDFTLRNLVHDEWQTEVRGPKEDAERLGELQCQALRDVGDHFNLFCPMDGEYRIGKNWKDTH